jgi:hypothetical protein
MSARLVFGVAALALAWPAAAQATDYGGGAAPASFSRSTGQLVLVGMRTTPAGRVRVHLFVSARCGFGAVRHAVPLNPDGTFAFNVPIRHRLRGNRLVIQRARLAISGQVAGGTATGVASTRIVQRRNGRVIARCRSGQRSWKAYAAGAEATPAGPQPGGAYFGLTNQPMRVFPFVLRVSPNARRVRIAAFDFRQRCGEGFYESENLTPSGAIRADGTFRLRERFSISWAEGRERYRVRVDGRFTPNGVSGTLSVRSVLRSPSGRVLDRCRTGRVGFAALL